MSDLIEHVTGGYSFLPGIPAFSEGIIAFDGFAVRHLRLTKPVPMEDGYALVERTLAAANRPMSSLCGMELRISEQMEVEAFRTLNRDYIETIRDRWGLFQDGINPIPRCNLALTVDPVTTPSLTAFSLTFEKKGAQRNFVTAGINDAVLVFGPDVFGQVARGDVLVRADNAPDLSDDSAADTERRLRFILDKATHRMKALGVEWSDATQVELYLGRPLGDLMEKVVWPAIAPAGQMGIRWYPGLAPFIGPIAEMDVRGFAEEIIIKTGFDT